MKITLTREEFKALQQYFAAHPQEETYVLEITPSLISTGDDEEEEYCEFCDGPYGSCNCEEDETEEDKLRSEAEDFFKSF